jgi:peroxiredoxin
MSWRLGALVCVLALLALIARGSLQSADTDPGKTSEKVASFSLKDPRDQKIVTLGQLKDRKAIAVVFLGTECPISNAFLPCLASLAEQYTPRGVQFVGINANSQDTPEHIATHARKNNIPFPVLKDVGNKVADSFGARRTPEVFVLSPEGRILYRGRIDDQFGIGYNRANKPTRQDLALALDEVLAGKPVTVAIAPVAGCLIGRVSKPKAEGSVTFAQQVSRILQKNCQECHRPGQIGPMSLLTYDDAVAWADNIREVVSERRMPPWFADPRHGKFANDRSLSTQERDTLLAWVDQGAPKGDVKDLPTPRSFPEGWVIGKPDVIFQMAQPYQVPAETPKGGIPYQFFTVKTDFAEDHWIERAEARPGAAAVVHHIVVFIVGPNEVFRPDGPGSVLCGTAPGDMPLILKPGLAKKIPAGGRLIFQMHYTPNGQAVSDQSSVGLIFSKNPPQHRVLTKPVHSRSFITRLDSIPAGADNYRMEADYTFREDSHIIDFMPHMHLRGKDFLYEAHYPDGKTEVLLSVPHYNFNWQSVYRPAEPVAMPKGTRLHCVAHFDNSTKNPNNPDASQPVFWGDQTWEEMMIGWIDYYSDRDTP